MAIFYGLLHPVILFFEGGFWYLYLEIMTAVLGFISLVFGLLNRTKKTVMYGVIGVVPIVVFQAILFIGSV